VRPPAPETAAVAPPPARGVGETHDFSTIVVKLAKQKP